MKYVWYVIAGLVGGVLGGMGMGGGTLLIPILNIIFNLKQQFAQTINLISFIPMAIIALIIHIKNGYVKLKNVLFIIIPGALTCVGGCFLADIISGKLLSKLFGGFLIALAILQFVLSLKNQENN